MQPPAPRLDDLLIVDEEPGADEPYRVLLLTHRPVMEFRGSYPTLDEAEAALRGEAARLCARYEGHALVGREGGMLRVEICYPDDPSPFAQESWYGDFLAFRQACRRLAAMLEAGGESQPVTAARAVKWRLESNRLILIDASASPPAYYALNCYPTRVIDRQENAKTLAFLYLLEETWKEINQKPQENP